MSSNAHARDCEGAAGAEMPQCGNARGDGEGGASSGQCNSDSGIELESSSIAAAGLFDAFEGAGSVAEAAAAEATAGEAAAEAAAEEAAARLVGGFAPLVAAAAGLALRAEEAAGRLRSLDTTGILAYASATGTLEKTKAYNKTQANYNYKTVLVMRIQWLRAVRMRGSEDARCFAKKRGSSLSGAHAMTYVRCSRVGARPPAAPPRNKGLRFRAAMVALQFMALHTLLSYTFGWWSAWRLYTCARAGAGGKSGCVVQATPKKMGGMAEHAYLRADSC